ncbi:gp53-like domain-containing protein [Brucella anthropi]|uniref:gp53-like domain-containing protein n=1 Tax=Brucella anthropi TaxID=529 RepID=UPI0005BA23FA|nr:hypothetical protein [Brucella anthropi]KIU69107.1 hypothetical protein TR92_07470 [Brucella anthropi]
MASQGRYLPDWTIGTLTLEADTVDFTTTDSLLVTAEIQPGDTIITASGLTLPIAEITGENAGKLAYPCPAAAAGVDQPLRIRYQSETSRYTGMAATLFKMLGGGNLFSLGELQGAEGDYLRFLAPGVLEAVAGGNLDALAAMTLGKSKVLVTDANNQLDQSDISVAALVLLKLAGAAAENKLPYFDGNDSAGLADFTDAARVLLKLAGVAAANKLPYFDSESTAALADFTALARILLSKTTGAQVWQAIGGSSTSSAIKFPDGTILMRGNNTLPQAGFGGIPFPSAFPTACLGVLPTIRENPGGNYAYAIAATVQDRGSFYGTGHSIVNGGAVALAPVSFNWIAWGN